MMDIEFSTKKPSTMCSIVNGLRIMIVFIIPFLNFQTIKLIINKIHPVMILLYNFIVYASSSEKSFK